MEEAVKPKKRRKKYKCKRCGYKWVSNCRGRKPGRCASHKCRSLKWNEALGPMLTCQRCNYSWRQDGPKKPIACASRHCRSPLWDTPRKYARKVLARPFYKWDKKESA